MTYETRVSEIFGVIISLLKDSHYTIVLDTYGGYKGGLQHISLATQEQAARHTATQILFSGTSKEVYSYLKGWRDLLNYMEPKDFFKPQTK